MNHFSEDRKDKQKDKISQFKAQLSSKGITIDFSKEEIERFFPHLVKEINNPNKGSYYSLNSESNEFELNENDDSKDNFDNTRSSGKNGEDGLERIEYLKKRTTSRYDESSELFYPKTEDFLRRCKDLDEAEEIIAFQLKMREIDEEKAQFFKKICKSQGLEYFGPRKKHGYYEDKYRRTSS